MHKARLVPRSENARQARRAGDAERDGTRSVQAEDKRTIARLQAVQTVECATSSACDTSKLFGTVPGLTRTRFIDPADPDGRINASINRETRLWLREATIDRKARTS